MFRTKIPFYHLGIYDETYPGHEDKQTARSINLKLENFLWRAKNKHFLVIVFIQKNYLPDISRVRVSYGGRLQIHKLRILRSEAELCLATSEVYDKKPRIEDYALEDLQTLDLGILMNKSWSSCRRSNFPLGKSRCGHQMGNH